MSVERLTKRVGLGEAILDTDEGICDSFIKAGACKTGYNGGYRSSWKRKCNDECILGILIDRLAAYEDTGLTPERCAELAKAEGEGRILPKGFGYARLTDGTHVVFKPSSASFRIETMENYSASIHEAAEAALAERKRNGGL